MNRKYHFKSTVSSILPIFICCLLVLSLISGCKKSEKENEGGIGKASPGTAVTEEKAVTIDIATQQRSGLIVKTLEPVSHRKELRAYGIVLELQGLLALRTDYTSAKVRKEKERANLGVSYKQYERAKALNAEGKNVSDKDLQAARAAWQTDKIDFRASENALRVLEDAARQQWGDAITQWLVNGSPALDRLLRQEDVLVQISLPPDAGISEPPRTAWIVSPEENLVSAEFVSVSPRADPRIQGMSFFYLIGADKKGLLPGINVVANLPSGPEEEGFVIPSSAVIWWQGNAWVYMREDTVHFVRREVSTANPIKDGYFVTGGFKEGDSIVVKGAQLILSEEFRAELQGGEEED